MPRSDIPGTPSLAKRAARSLAAREGISYTTALRALTGVHPPIPPEAVAAATIDPAARFTADVHSLEAQDARRDAARIRYWEERRAGRPARLWTAYIEVMCAAVSDDEAFWRLATYLRKPVFRVPGLGTDQLQVRDVVSRDRGRRDGHLDCVAPVPAGDLDPDELDQIMRDYPVRPTPWCPGMANDRQREHDVYAYARALRRAAARARGETLPPLPADEAAIPNWGVWVAVHSAYILAGPHIVSARRRAEELAATVVDHDGRQLGRMVEVEPVDGSRHPATGDWTHPANVVANELACLWDDHDAEAEDETSAAKILAGDADRLQFEHERHQLAVAALESRMRS